MHTACISAYLVFQIHRTAVQYSITSLHLQNLRNAGNFARAYKLNSQQIKGLGWVWAVDKDLRDLASLASPLAIQTVKGAGQVLFLEGNCRVFQLCWYVCLLNSFTDSWKPSLEKV